MKNEEEVEEEELQLEKQHSTRLARWLNTN